VLSGCLLVGSTSVMLTVTACLTLLNTLLQIGDGDEENRAEAEAARIRADALRVRAKTITLHLQLLMLLLLLLLLQLSYHPQENDVFTACYDFNLHTQSAMPCYVTQLHTLLPC
jgi:hypothetical protein